ncbi:hypothetical protein [Thermus hydrothermalis]|uniref:hypothetical protein n=1 Tax=Thermus hydrothermalis TaxID=2908148 RepID=UPI001FAA4083|nr:hypothetical protein [Thermus hydrothermalis]
MVKPLAPLLVPATPEPQGSLSPTGITLTSTKTCPAGGSLEIRHTPNWSDSGVSFSGSVQGAQCAFAEPEPLEYRNLSFTFTGSAQGSGSGALFTYQHQGQSQVTFRGQTYNLRLSLGIRVQAEYQNGFALVYNLSGTVWVNGQAYPVEERFSLTYTP